MRHFMSVLALGLSALGASQGALAASAAEVLLITGRGTATDPIGGGIRELAKGDAIYPGEVISAAVNSYINLKFSDGGFILLRPNSRFVVEDFAEAEAEPATVTPAPATVTPPPAPAVAAAPTPTPKPAPGGKKAGKQPTAPAAAPAAPPVAAAPVPPAPAPRSSRAFFRLLKGGFRAVSGLIGKANPAEYRVSTPVATIGIRGTDYLVVICDAACARDPLLRSELPPEVAALEGGIVTGIMQGSIGVTTEAPVTPVASRSDMTVALEETTLSHPLLWSGLTLAPLPNSETHELSAPDGTPRYAVVTTDRQYIPLSRAPGFLQRDPMPNPTTLCQ